MAPTKTSFIRLTTYEFRDAWGKPPGEAHPEAVHRVPSYNFSTTSFVADILKNLLHQSGHCFDLSTEYYLERDLRQPKREHLFRSNTRQNLQKITSELKYLSSISFEDWKRKAAHPKAVNTVPFCSSYFFFSRTSLVISIFGSFLLSSGRSIWFYLLHVKSYYLEFDLH
jgi:hypothetical protein